MSSCLCGGSINWDTSSDWTACIGVGDNSLIAFWTWASANFNTLVSDALALVSAAAFVVWYGNQFLTVIA